MEDLGQERGGALFQGTGGCRGSNRFQDGEGFLAGNLEDLKDLQVSLKHFSGFRLVSDVRSVEKNPLDA